MINPDSHILCPLKGVPPAFQGLGGLDFQFYGNKKIKSLKVTSSDSKHTKEMKII